MLNRQILACLCLAWFLSLSWKVVNGKDEGVDDECRNSLRRRKIRNLAQDRLWGLPSQSKKSLLTATYNESVVLLKFPRIPLPPSARLWNASLQLSTRSLDVPFAPASMDGNGSNPTTTATTTISAFRMTDAWSERNTPSSPKLEPGVNALVQTSFVETLSLRKRVLETDVTEDVRLWLNASALTPNEGWALQMQTEGSSWTFFSSDNPNKKVAPKLIVWFCQVPSLEKNIKKNKRTVVDYVNETEVHDVFKVPVLDTQYVFSKPIEVAHGIFPTYVPGDLKVVVKDNMGRAVRMSTGMTGRPIAYSRTTVHFDDGSKSPHRFHGAPDAAAVFTEHDGTYVYTSNSESKDGRGGVFSLKFNATTHAFIDYFPVLTGTSFNCGGGRTPWNTWITCEEAETWGRVWQVDPFGRIPQGNLTGLVDRGGSYESAAYQMVKDERDGIEYPVFYITEDDEFGDLVRFVPDDDGRACYRRGQQWCTLEHGTHSFLRLIFLTHVPRTKAGSGNFTFGRREDANGNDYLMAEGIDIKDNILYFTSKFQKRLYILNLLEGTFTYSSTRSGAFEHEPDQVSRILGEDGEPSDILYFCEDGDFDCGVHARSADGRFYGILDGEGYKTETTGLAFSPDGTRMYVSFQMPGTIWQFWRTDGLPFGGKHLDIKYHST